MASGKVESFEKVAWNARIEKADGAGCFVLVDLDVNLEKVDKVNDFVKGNFEEVGEMVRFAVVG